MGENDLATIRPDLADEWDYEKNGDIKPCNVARSAKLNVWWKCSECGNEYQAIINSRASKNVGCPICNKEKARLHLHDYYMKKNGSLESNFPEIAKEWHPTKNGTLKPTDVTASTNTKVWWLGECGHEWQASISHRVPHNNIKGTGCPYCSSKKGSLADNYPEIAKEWNYNKNVDLKPPDVTSSSNKKVWWKCLKCGNEWQAFINNRTGKGAGCPNCANARGKQIQRESSNHKPLYNHKSLSIANPELAKE